MTFYLYLLFVSTSYQDNFSVYGRSKNMLTCVPSFNIPSG